MESQEVILHANRIIDTLQSIDTTPVIYDKNEQAETTRFYVQAAEFLRVFAGPKSSFYEHMKSIKDYYPDRRIPEAISILQSFVDYIEAGLHDAISPTRQAQLDVVSDFLEQARELLDRKGIHPAAPAVLIGASLEEFLRTWVEEEGLSLGGKRPSIDAYMQALRGADVITSQDVKDITAWGGLRNSAAHGKFDEIDKPRVQIMLEGVNLFMRKYGT